MKTLSRLRNHLSLFWLKTRQRSSVLQTALRRLALVPIRADCSCRNTLRAR
jgi:hypothetical protein